MTRWYDALPAPVRILWEGAFFLACLAAVLVAIWLVAP